MPGTAYVSTPVIALGGQVDPAVAADLVSLTVEETIVGMCWCQARFNNIGYRNGNESLLYLGRDKIDFGTELAVTLGAPGESRQVFSGKISALQADFPADEAPMLLAFAEDPLQALRLTRRTRTFEEVTTADVAQRVAGDHGLTPDVSLDGPTHKVVAQLNQSDLAFLRSQARVDDGEVWIDGSTLHVARRPDRDGGRVALTYGGALMAFSVRADLADQCREVGVAGWDVASKSPILETADASALGSELAALTSGASILGSSFTDRKERLVREAPIASDEARAHAKAAYLERARRFVCGTGQTWGTAAVRVGTTLALSGLGGMFNGDYYVSRTRHTYDLQRGFRTEFDVERPGIGATP